MEINSSCEHVGKVFHIISADHVRNMLTFIFNRFQEMTESVNMPLTGICTPLPKQDSRFPFPSNVVEKVCQI